MIVESASLHPALRTVAVLPLRRARLYGCAPPRRPGYEIQVAGDPAGRETDHGREGRVGELQVGELLHAHTGRHGGRPDLDDLDGLLAHDVRPEDAARGAGDDELA